MPIRLDGTNTTANPGITGADADTGLQFGTDEISFVTGGTNRATVESNGNFTIENGNLVLASGSGIDFSATADSSGTMTSELLDDYEIGTWTPTVNFGTINSNHQAQYTKIGRLVTVSAILHTFSDRTTTSDIRVQGLPYAPHTPYQTQSVGSTFTRHVNNGSYTSLNAYTEYSNHSIYFYFHSHQSSVGYNAAQYNHLTNANAQIRFQVQYLTS